MTLAQPCQLPYSIALSFTSTEYPRQGLGFVIIFMIMTSAVPGTLVLRFTSSIGSRSRGIRSGRRVDHGHMAMAEVSCIWHGRPSTVSPNFIVGTSRLGTMAMQLWYRPDFVTVHLFC